MGSNDETTPILHPVQFPGGVGGTASPDHIYGSALPPRRIGYQGRHRAPLSPISEKTWNTGIKRIRKLGPAR